MPPKTRELLRSNTLAMISGKSPVTDVIDEIPPHRDTPFARLRARLLAGGSLRRAADLVALIYIGAVAIVATVTGAYYMLFPELSALSWDVMERPRGRWAGAPLMLAATPALTGFAGTIVTRTLPYGFLSVFVIVLISVAILRTMKSPIAPAISAGLLPLVIGVTSWWYSPSILFGTTLLAAISIPWKRYAAAFAGSHRGDATRQSAQAGQHIGSACGSAEQQPTDSNSTGAFSSDGFATVNPSSNDARVTVVADDAAICVSSSEDATADEPSATAARHLLPPLLTFIAIALIAVKLTGMRFILFPPLVVILYEMLSHREHCPWVGRPIALPIACFLSALGGYLFFSHIASPPIVAMLSMAWGIAVLRTLNLHMPPVLAVALLPLVMTNPTIAYPVSVGLGTMLASAWFEVLGKWQWIGPSPSASTS